MQTRKKPLKIRQRLLAAVMAFALLFGVMAVPDMQVRAQDMIIALSAKTIRIGDKLTVKVSVPAGVSASVNVNYPTSLLTYVKASEEASVNAGTVTMSIGEYGSTQRGSASITFEAKASGDAGIAVSAPRASSSDGDQVSVGGASTIVKIENEAAEDQKSADSSLQSLSVSEGELSPAFSPDVLSYTLDVENAVSSLDISASPKDGAAKVQSVEGAESLSVGENTIKIKVLAENGTSSVYTIQVTRAQEEPSDKEISTEEVQKDTEVAPQGVCLKSEFGYITIVSDVSEAEVSALPKRYEPKELSIPDKGTVTAYFSEENSNICLIYAMNSMGENAWYQYDIRERTYLRWYGQSLTAGSGADDGESSLLDLKSENKLIFWAFIIVVAILLVIILVLMLMKAKGSDDELEDDFMDLDEPDDDLTETEEGQKFSEPEIAKTEETEETEETKKTQKAASVSGGEIAEIGLPEIGLPEDELIEAALQAEKSTEDTVVEDAPVEETAVEEEPEQKKPRRSRKSRKNQAQTDEEEDGLEFIDL